MTTIRPSTISDEGDQYDQINSSMKLLAAGVVAFLLIVSAILLIFYIDVPYRLRITSAYLLPIPVMGILSFVILFFRRRAGPVPVIPLTIGIFLVAGSAAFDMLATVIHSPDLKDEMNFVARSLLDSGHTVSFVYIYGICMQALYVSILSVLWASFLKYRSIFLESSFSIGANCFPLFLKAAMGGGKLTWWEAFFDMRAISRMSFFHFLCFFIPFFVVCSIIYRTFLGLEWYNFVPYTDQFVLISLIMSVVLAGIIIWLYFKYRGLKQSAPETLDL